MNSTLSEIINKIPHTTTLSTNPSQRELADFLCEEQLTSGSSSHLHALSVFITEEKYVDQVFSSHPELAISLLKNSDVSGQWLVDNYNSNDLNTHIFLKHPNFPMDELMKIINSEPGVYGENDIAVMSHNPNLSIEVMHSIAQTPGKGALYGLLNNPDTPAEVLLTMVKSTYMHNPTFILNFILHPNYNSDVAKEILTTFHGRIDDNTLNILLDTLN